MITTTESGRRRGGYDFTVEIESPEPHSDPEPRTSNSGPQSDKVKSRMYLRMIRAHRPVMKLNDEPDPYQKTMQFAPADKTGGWNACNNGFRR